MRTVPNNDTLVTEGDLKDWSGYKTRKKLAAWLRENDIHYYLGKGGRICTTTDFIGRERQEGELIFGKTTQI